MSSDDVRAIPSAHLAKEYVTPTTIRLHPLVVVNITDSFTRLNLDGALNPANAGKPIKTRRAIGALLGQQDSRAVEIHTSFEVLYTEETTQHGPTVKIDVDYMTKTKAQYNTVFPDYEIVGWYTTGAGLSLGDILVTNRMVADGFCDNPIVLVMDTNPAANISSLPVYLFESVGTVIGNAHLKAAYVRKVRYQVESEESERIGIDTAMKVDFASERNPTLNPQTQRLTSAVTMLKMRLMVVIQYLKDIRAKTIPADYEILRQICTVTNQLPCADSPSFNQTVGQDYQDAVLVALLSTVTKSLLMLTRVVDKSGVFADRRKGYGGALM